MLFGRRDEFAIECFHDSSVRDAPWRVVGRISIWCRGVELGDSTEADCCLNHYAEHFKDCLARLADLRDDAVDGLSDEAAFRFLDAALYLDDERSDEEVEADSHRFWKFGFLTGWGEPFNGIKAFLLRSAADFRILYRLRSGETESGTVSRDKLIDAMRAFADWMAAEERGVPFT